MNSRSFRRLAALGLASVYAIAGTFSFPSSSTAQVAESAPEPIVEAAPGAEATPGMEVLTRGPIHEAFAEPVDRDPGPGLVVSKEPPAPVRETPPAVKPEGENVIWISGYWAWDDDRDDFLWVSGVWRAAPPGQRWTPGYWNRADGGWQWVAGFWAPIESEEFDYLPTPPASLETGPTSDAPSDSHFWTPGCWVYEVNDYTWRPGYWSVYRPNWVWVCSRYVWTPAGCIYIPGYWDYTLAYRGQLFAPVYYSQPIYYQPTYYYTPWCVIPTSSLMVHLWVRPNYCHYYFGDYYGYDYCYPWWRYDRDWYCPMMSYYRTAYRRQGIDFVGRLRGWNDYFVHHADVRPPRTWRHQQEFLGRSRDHAHIERIALARTLDQAIKAPELKRDFVRLADADRTAIAERSNHWRELTSLRNTTETAGRLKFPAAGPAGVGDASGDAQELARQALDNRAERLKLKLPKSDLDLAGRKAQGAPELLEDALRRHSVETGKTSPAAVQSPLTGAGPRGGRNPLSSQTDADASQAGAGRSPADARTPKSVQELQQRLGELRRGGGAATGRVGAGGDTGAGDAQADATPFSRPGSPRAFEEGAPRGSGRTLPGGDPSPRIQQPLPDATPRSFSPPGNRSRGGAPDIGQPSRGPVTLPDPTPRSFSPPQGQPRSFVPDSTPRVPQPSREFQPRSYSPSIERQPRVSVPSSPSFGGGAREAAPRSFSPRSSGSGFGGSPFSAPRSSDSSARSSRSFSSPSFSRPSVSGPSFSGPSFGSPRGGGGPSGPRSSRFESGRSPGPQSPSLDRGRDSNPRRGRGRDRD